MNGPSNPVPVDGIISGEVEITNTSIPVTLPPMTHMGVKVQDHIRLVTGSGGDSTCPDTGVILQDAFKFFVVPQGKALVVTDVNYGVRAKTGFPWTLGTLVSVDIRTSGTTSSRAWQSGVVADQAIVAGQVLWHSEKILGGLVIKAGETICLTAGLGFEPRGEASFINLSKIYGYLIDAN